MMSVSLEKEFSFWPTKFKKIHFYNSREHSYSFRKMTCSFHSKNSSKELPIRTQYGYDLLYNRRGRSSKGETFERSEFLMNKNGLDKYTNKIQHLLIYHGFLLILKLAHISALEILFEKCGTDFDTCN